MDMQKRVERAQLSPSGPIASPASDPQHINALAREAATGDLVSTRRLLDYIWPTMARVVVGVMGAGHPDLDDAVQQSLIALLQSLPTFRGECHAAGYASRIALRVALRARNRSRVRAARTEAFVHQALDTTEAPSAGDDALAHRRRRLLRDLLGDLPEEQADALGLRVLLGWSLEEVASATGAPINTVRSRVRLAKEALRRKIEADPALADELAVVE
jgi:RNA polymerase sigma-70 factor, ECF subfamily